jgi:hypothetical protein
MKKIIFCGLIAFLGISAPAHSAWQAAKSCGISVNILRDAINEQFPYTLACLETYGDLLWLISEYYGNPSDPLTVQQAMIDVLTELFRQSLSGAQTDSAHCHKIKERVDFLVDTIDNKIIPDLEKWKHACSPEDWALIKNQKTLGFRLPQTPTENPTSADNFLLKSTGIKKLFNRLATPENAELLLVFLRTQELSFLRNKPVKEAKNRMLNTRSPQKAQQLSAN